MHAHYVRRTAINQRTALHVQLRVVRTGDVTVVRHISVKIQIRHQAGDEGIIRVTVIPGFTVVLDTQRGLGFGHRSFFITRGTFPFVCKLFLLLFRQGNKIFQADIRMLFSEPVSKLRNLDRLRFRNSVITSVCIKMLPV